VPNNYGLIEEHVYILDPIVDCLQGTLSTQKELLNVKQETYQLFWQILLLYGNSSWQLGYCSSYSSLYKHKCLYFI